MSIKNLGCDYIPEVTYENYLGKFNIETEKMKKEIPDWELRDLPKPIKGILNSKKHLLEFYNGVRDEYNVQTGCYVEITVERAIELLTTHAYYYWSSYKHKNVVPVELVTPEMIQYCFEKENKWIGFSANLAFSESKLRDLIGIYDYDKFMKEGDK